MLICLQLSISLDIRVEYWNVIHCANSATDYRPSRGIAQAA